MRTLLAPDIQNKVKDVVFKLRLDYIKPENIVCMRSYGAKTRAIARIWSLPKIWQQALHFEPHYIIEVVSEKYDKQSDAEKDRTVIHELMHIPKGFGGGLVPHLCFGKRINTNSVEKLYEKYKAASNSQIDNFEPYEL